MARKYHPARPQNAGEQPVYPMKCRIRAAAGVTRIDVFDDIGAPDGVFGGGISAADFAAQLGKVRGALDVHVSSAGGDVFDGVTIYNALRDHAGPVTTVVDGLAASIASVIVQGGGTRVVQPGSIVMVHDAFGVKVGNAAELRTFAGVLDKVSGELAAIYAEHAGGSREAWRNTMRAETWYTAEEAVAAGLADRVGTGRAQLPAGLDLAALANVPGRIAAQLRALPAAAPGDALQGKMQRFGERLEQVRGAAEHAHPVGISHTHSGDNSVYHTHPDPDQFVFPAMIYTSAPGESASQDTPAAALNGYEWARSLGGFLRAIGDKDDRSGAKAVISRVMRAAGTLSERVPSEGGFLVPERLRQEIESFMTGAVIIPRSLPVPMDSLRVPVPILDAPNQSDGVLGGMTFAMVAESAAITPTVPNFGVLALEARKFAAYLQAVPNELCDDSPVFTDLFLPRIVAQGLAWAEDNLAVNGTGVGEPQGLLNAPAALTQVRTTSDTVGVADIVGMMKQLHPQSKRSKDTCWLLGDDLFGALLELATLTGSPTSGVSGPQLWLEYDAGAGFWRLLGYPAFPTDWQPALGSTGDCILVDLSLYLWGTRGEMTIERSAKGGGFASNTSNFRFRHRVDGRFWPQSSYTLSNSQVVSPLVILAEAA